MCRNGTHLNPFRKQHSKNFCVQLVRPPVFHQGPGGGQNFALYFPLPTLCCFCSFNFRGLSWNCGGLCAFSSFQNVCCEDIWNDENAQRPPQFNEGPRKLEKKGRERKKRREILDGPGRGSRVGVSGAGVSRATGSGARGSKARGSGAASGGCWSVWRVGQWGFWSVGGRGGGGKW